mmetsp:Transcript_10019/g.25449  ORF Transcript_10019/g.25449 Transcript_10019/m.25449 type:complete len:230 (-) Transcript_10019:107-796(-)
MMYTRFFVAVAEMRRWWPGSLSPPRISYWYFGRLFAVTFSMRRRFSSSSGSPVISGAKPVMSCLGPPSKISSRLMSALNPTSRKRSTGATMTARSPSVPWKRRSTSAPPRSAIEVGFSSQPSGTLNEYGGISLQPTPCPPLLPSGLVYLQNPSLSTSESPGSLPATSPCMAEACCVFMASPAMAKGTPESTARRPKSTSSSESSRDADPATTLLEDAFFVTIRHLCDDE